MRNFVFLPNKNCILMAQKGILTVMTLFSDIYPEEGFCPDGAVKLDFTDLPGTECYCDPDALCTLRERLAPLPARALHWIDGGDYHYLSKLWMEKLEAPFTLVLFDRHSDNQPGAFGEGLLSCGGWVAASMRDNPFHRHTVWIQAPGDPLPPLDGPVYLSIDKDILSTDYARTNWDQGTMSLSELKDRISQIAERVPILGIDVCGGLAVSKGARPEDIAINRRTDEELQDFLLSLQN